jgi:7,8-dihydropterin-6-yl-methyl-4-(beta-D-ribofuranosyl)aminobenzene 5'-phosphate synthase
MRKTWCLASLPILFIATIFGMQPISCQKGSEQKIIKDFTNTATPISDLTITIIYDNNHFKEGLETAWGFSCILNKTEKTILFDTGGDGSLLMRNMKKLKVDPKTIDSIVLSHIHGDHTGGLKTFLAESHKVIVYVLKSFPANFKKDVEKYGAEMIEVHEPLKICENVYSTGELGMGIKEQSLIIHTNKGLIVITGCAHPGILKIVNEAKNLINDDVLFVMGGFHLGSKSKSQIEEIIASFKNLGVQYVGPCHCSGDPARILFENEYEKHFIKIGVGKEITMKDFE